MCTDMGVPRWEWADEGGDLGVERRVDWDATLIRAKSSVSDPDLDSGVFWIRIRIPNPDPGL